MTGKHSFKAQLSALAEPVMIIVNHFIVVVIAVITIYLVDQLLEKLGLRDRLLPLLGISFSDWLFEIDVFSVALILLIGLVKACMSLGRSG